MVTTCYILYLYVGVRVLMCVCARIDVCVCVVHFPLCLVRFALNPWARLRPVPIEQIKYGGITHDLELTLLSCSPSVCLSVRLSVCLSVRLFFSFSLHCGVVSKHLT